MGLLGRMEVINCTTVPTAAVYADANNVTAVDRYYSEKLLMPSGIC